MAQIAEILDHRVDFDPAGDFEAFLRQVPAKWVVYCFADAAGQALQLLCVKNLRASLKRRLQGEQTLCLTKRVNYRDIVGQIHWRRVDSAFEADWIYHDIARQIFPGTYQGMVGFRPAWFVHIDPDAEFPRYCKTIDVANKAGLCIGPVEDKHAAARLIELMEDAFDLCRYYNILIQSPRGRACAYKEMGKCPAPCDGSISMEQYRRMVEWSAATLADPGEMIRQQNQRMQQAAAEQRFETASKIKTFIEQLSQLGKGPFRHARPLRDFAYAAIQSGPNAGSAKVFLILPGLIEEIADLLEEPTRPSELLGAIFSAAEEHAGVPLDAQGVERIGIVAHHLFSPKQSQGIFLPLADISEKAIVKAYKDLLRQKRPDDVEGEGVVKELQAM
ncbi:MAG: UvrB/UvrC motif-containing protein [Tepidisphaeraceae bacterium]